MNNTNIETLSQPALVRAQVQAWRQQGLRVALVPTMGNLHQGHATLVREARKYADKVVVSIFVNPLQFGPSEDFHAYPRTPDDDRQLLVESRAELLFLPTVDDLYPHGMPDHTTVTVPGMSDQLCGAFRPGHFTGVATVVAKLFNVVQPDVALFGEKDFQQLAIIKRMTVDLCIPVDVIGVATVRDADGLALSSRNRYLTPEQRQLAPHIYKVLSQVTAKITAGARDYVQLEQEASRALTDAGFKPDYVAIRDANTLQPAGPMSAQLVVLTAARLGRARLLDNVRVALHSG